MIRIGKAADRGRGEHGWLSSRHTFSFAGYRDQEHMGFRSLRVMNEDRVAAGNGFGTHPHDNMEIISYVLEGELEHKDSMGNGSIIRAGEVQRMSAGTGVTHSEFNASKTEPVHFLQIWLLPEEQGLEPGYEQRGFDDQDRQNTLQLIASPDGRNGSLCIRQQSDIFLAALAGEQAVRYQLRAGRKIYVQVTRGSVAVNGHAVQAGDGAAITELETVELSGDEGGEVLLFDLP